MALRYVGNGECMYRNYHITFVVPLTKKALWEFCHDDFDGAPDAQDSRCGYAGSLSEACDKIDELEDG